MPTALIGPAIGLAGSALGALGGAGKQASQKLTQEQTQEGTQRTTQEEAGYFGQGRQDLVSQLMRSLAGAQQPIYGAAAKAGVFNDLNGLAADSISKLRGQLGGRGRSGFAEAAVGDIERQRFGGLSQFLTGLPMQESQAQYDRTLGLLGPAMGFFGQAPRSQTTTSTGKNTMTGDSATFGPGFGRGLAGGLSGLLGDWAGMGGRDPISQWSKGW